LGRGRRCATAGVAPEWVEMGRDGSPGDRARWGRLAAGGAGPWGWGLTMPFAKRECWQGNERRQAWGVMGPRSVGGVRAKPMTPGHRSTRARDLAGCCGGPSRRHAGCGEAGRGGTWSLGLAFMSRRTGGMAGVEQCCLGAASGTAPRAGKGQAAIWRRRAGQGRARQPRQDITRSGPGVRAGRGARGRVAHGRWAGMVGRVPGQG
jgi:hypothetical protein